MFASLSPERFFREPILLIFGSGKLLSSLQTMVVAAPNVLSNAENDKKRKTTLEKAKAHHVRLRTFTIFQALMAG